MSKVTPFHRILTTLPFFPPLPHTLAVEARRCFFLPQLKASRARAALDRVPKSGANFTAGFFVSESWSCSQSSAGKEVEQQPSWTDDLPSCHLSGVGSAPNRSYSADGKGTEGHPLEDNWLKFRSENNCYLYGVFNGYDGNRVTNFVGQRLSAELLLGQLHADHSDADVRRVLLQAFDVVERSFLESIDDALAEKASLQSQLPEGVPHHQLPPQYQKIVERLKAVEQEISGGAMAIVAVVLNNKLYIANVGTNRALLCKSTVDGLQVTQLNVDHTTENEDELFRFSQLGLDAGKIKQVGTIRGQESTRRIGDYKVKYGYTDIELLSAAKSKPIIAEPEIHGGHSLDGVTGFLVLMSEGLYKALEAAHGPGQANQEIAAMIATEFAKQTSLDAVAQAVVDRVKRIHCDTFASGGERSKFCPRHEDMTLLVRNFGYPLGEMSQPTLTPTQGGRVYPVSVPYSSSQSTSKTSVTLSLVMPSQGQMVNGAHSSSTLDEATPTLTNQSPTVTLQSTNTHTQSSSSSSDGGLFRSRPTHSLQPDEDGRVEPYVDFAEFYRLWNMDHGEQGVLTVS
ncbi:TGF-beta-activated kinase 1 and MAP3K7-binding protein 1 [Egretta garzetta]|nr:TGF-beta-activated kinase 1 and MAP3K7-binding protein 1 [Egretta garzetta]